MRLRAVLVVIAMVLASACGATATHTAGTPTTAIGSLTSTAVSAGSTAAASPTVSRSSTPPASPTPDPPARAWMIPPTTGIAELDAIIRGVTSGDPTALESSFVVQEGECRTEDAWGLGTILCARGVPDRTKTPFFEVLGSCESASVRIDRASGSGSGGVTIAELATGAVKPPRFLWMVAHARNPAPTNDEYRLYFLNSVVATEGWEIVLNRSWQVTVMGVVTGRACNPTTLARIAQGVAASSDLLIPPP